MAWHYYDTTCSVARFASGKSNEAAQVDDKERKQLWQQALAWLRADLADHTRLGESGSLTARWLVQQLQHWQQDSDLVCMRDVAGRQLDLRRTDDVRATGGQRGSAADEGGDLREGGQQGMNEPHDPNVTSNLPSAGAESPPTDATLRTTELVRGSVSTGGSHPGTEARAGDLPAVPGYQVLHEIARGGMGRVLAAYDLGLDRDIALKVLLPGR